MIISHAHRFIFFAVPKTATHAVRQALRLHLGPDDWEQQFLFGEQALPIPAIAKMRHGHISARQIQPHLGQDTWRNYFKFGFVRNPYDRFISTCFFLHRGNPEFAASAVPFMKRAIQSQRFRRRILVMPQYYQLVGANGEIAMDRLGRYENLQRHFDDICRHIGIPAEDLSRKNPSQHSAYTSYYDDELRELVAEFYADDLRLFDYDFLPNEPTN